MSQNKPLWHICYVAIHLFVVEYQQSQVLIVSDARTNSGVYPEGRGAPIKNTGARVSFRPPPQFLAIFCALMSRMHLLPSLH